jgi:ABC-type nickel/cobalt efflux system permease component RcnA
MDWNASVGLILLAAFGIGALHALEPGHGKSIMGAYLVAARGGVRHAFLLGLVVTVTHTIVVFLLAIGALVLAERFATSEVTLWLEVVSGLLVLGVGVWMILTSFNVLRPWHPHEHGHGHVHVHGHPHHHGHVHHGHTHDASVPEGRNPFGFWSLLAVGASGGLVPCPAALTALLAAVSLGRTGTGVAVVGAMSLGIAAMLITIGILFVQAGRMMSRAFNSRWLTVHVPRLSAVLITILGSVLILRTLLSEHH